MSDTKISSCDLSLDEHIDLMLNLMGMIGAGLGCERQYQAFAVLAEAARQVHGYESFDMTEPVAKLVADAKRIREQQQAKSRPAPVPQPTWFLPGSGKVH